LQADIYSLEMEWPTTEKAVEESDFLFSGSINREGEMMWSLSKKIYVDPAQDSLYKIIWPSSSLGANEPTQKRSIYLSTISNSYDSQVYEEMQGIIKDYHNRHRFMKDSLTKVIDFAARDKNYDVYFEAGEKLGGLWEENLAPKLRQVLQIEIGKHPNSVVSAYMLLFLSSYEENYSMHLEIFEKLEEHVRKSKYGISVKTKLESIAMMLTNTIFPPVKGITPKGKAYTFDISENEYTLVEFWASWCGPCRSAVPELKRLLSDYQAKGFNIIGVSIDTDKDAWLKAIQDDEPKWEQVSDLLPYSESENTLRYNIGAIPANYLVDKNGRVADRNISLVKLENILNSEFGN
jgi:thiol-disulfide isomerase/thioredoxin